MRFFLTLSLATVSVMAFAKSESTNVYAPKEIWTGNNNSSQSPDPHCICDIDRNVKDCLEVKFETKDAPDSLCYDEYIPEGSRGWVYAQVFVVVRDQALDRSPNGVKQSKPSPVSPKRN